MDHLPGSSYHRPTLFFDSDEELERFKADAELGRLVREFIDERPGHLLCSGLDDGLVHALDNRLETVASGDDAQAALRAALGEESE